MATKTIGTTARDYATLSAWASYVNALALTAPEIANCYNDGGVEITETTTIVIGGWTGGSGTNTVTLQAAAGHSFSDNANVQTNALFYNGANGIAFKNTVTGYGTAFEVSGGNVNVKGLQFKATSTQRECLRLSGSAITLDKGIIDAAGRTNTQAFYMGVSLVATNILIVVNGNSNCSGANIFQSTLRSGTIVSTVSNSSASIVGYNTNSLATNCVAYNFTGTFGNAITASASCTNNATSSTFAGTNWNNAGVTGITSAAFVAAGTDYRIGSSSALKNAGATVGPAYDIAGTTRPQGAAYDIGCWEYVSAGVAFIAQMLKPVLQSIGGMY